MQDISDTLIASMTPEELHYWRYQENAHIIFSRGHYWEQIFPGFYRPIHLLARLKSELATRPTLLSWGFQAALCQDDATAANGFIPVHLLSDVEAYDLQSLKKNCRAHIFKNRSLFKVVELLNSEILQQQGYEVYLSAMRRTNNTPILSKKQYLKSLKNFIIPERRLVLAGLLGEKLCGYITGYAVDGTAYGEYVYVANEGLKNNLNRILLFEFVQACRRSEKIQEICAGHHSPEKPGITKFKQEMGFPIQYIPAKVRINPTVARFIRWQTPNKYYRLTGHSTRYSDSE